MTLTRRLAAAALLFIAALLAGIAVLDRAATPATAQQPAAVVEPAAQVITPGPIVEPVLVALAPDSDLAPAHAEQLTLVADRVCEGWTAEVPLMVMRDTVAAELGVDDAEARAFVDTALTVHCLVDTSDAR